MQLPSSQFGVTSDSRAVKPGMIYVCVRGTSSDGHSFIADAIRLGASAIVGEEAQNGLSVPYHQVPDSRLALAELAASHYGHPSRHLMMVAVTGTSGKTTTTYLLESILKASGHQVGLIGTVECRYAGKRIEATHTTPGPVELQALLAEMLAAGCTAVVMEVSSHALKQHRVAFIEFRGAVFTNLTPEHLDYHPDMNDYFESKAILFRKLSEFSAIRQDDEWGAKLLHEMKASSKKTAGFDGHFGEVTLDGIRGHIDGLPFHSRLTGDFNRANISGAVTIARLLKLPDSAIVKGLEALPVVPGRLERVPNTRGLNVFVDYAHKPDALDKVLQTLQVVKGSGRLLTVFGCGGDRDRTKRPVMGAIAAKWSDWVCVTSDNPRTENPDAIIREIMSGVPGNVSFVHVEADRKAAIFMAMKEAKVGDLVLIAGKGHEDYQILAKPDGTGTYKIHFDDREVAAEALKS